MLLGAFDAIQEGGTDIDGGVADADRLRLIAKAADGIDAGCSTIDYEHPAASWQSVGDLAAVQD